MANNREIQLDRALGLYETPGVSPFVVPDFYSTTVPELGTQDNLVRAMSGDGTDLPGERPRSDIRRVSPDSFSRSATTGVAYAELGRRCLGGRGEGHAMGTRLARRRRGSQVLIW